MKQTLQRILHNYFLKTACSAGSDDSMSASGSAGPGFDPRKIFNQEVEMYTF